jgi:hypothetical protein
LFHGIAYEERLSTSDNAEHKTSKLLKNVIPRGENDNGNKKRSY